MPGSCPLESKFVEIYNAEKVFKKSVYREEHGSSLKV